MRLLTAALLVPLAAAFCAGPAAAGPGLTGAPILTRPVGARSSGMGRAFAAVPGDAESVMYNPAGPAFAPGSSVYLAHMNGFAGGHYGAAVLPLKSGALALTPAFIYFNSGAVTLNLSDGSGRTVIAELDKVALLSAAYLLTPSLAVGGSFKLTRIDLAETASASAAHYDAGALYRFTEAFSAGAASLNNGGDVRFEAAGDPAPATLRAGLMYKTEFRPDLLDSSADISYNDIALTADWSRTAREKGYYQAGAEMNMRMNAGLLLSLRGGYLFGRTDEGLTLGVGIKKGAWSFGLGYEASKVLDARLPVSLSLDF